MGSSVRSCRGASPRPSRGERYGRRLGSRLAAATWPGSARLRATLRPFAPAEHGGSADPGAQRGLPRPPRWPTVLRDRQRTVARDPGASAARRRAHFRDEPLRPPSGPGALAADLLLRGRSARHPDPDRLRLAPVGRRADRRPRLFPAHLDTASDRARAADAARPDVLREAGTRAGRLAEAAARLGRDHDDARYTLD